MLQKWKSCMSWGWRVNRHLSVPGKLASWTSNWKNGHMVSSLKCGYGNCWKEVVMFEYSVRGIRWALKWTCPVYYSPVFLDACWCFAVSQASVRDPALALSALLNESHIDNQLELMCIFRPLHCKKKKNLSLLEPTLFKYTKKNTLCDLLVVI